MIVIERYAEPLSVDKRGRPQRGQLHQAVFIDGEQVSELCHPVGSPAPWEVIKAHEETRRFE